MAEFAFLNERKADHLRSVPELMDLRHGVTRVSPRDQKAILELAVNATHPTLVRDATGAEHYPDPRGLWEEAALLEAEAFASGESAGPVVAEMRRQARTIFTLRRVAQQMSRRARSALLCNARRGLAPCTQCGQPITPGTPIWWNRDLAQGWHYACVEQT